MTCPRCQHQNRSGAQFCERCGTPVTGADSTVGPYADLKSEVESLRRSQREALERQTATAEILRVISQSPTDVQPVFNAIAKSAARFCDGIRSIVYRFDGDIVRMVAHHNARP